MNKNIVKDAVREILNEQDIASKNDVKLIVKNQLDLHEAEKKQEEEKSTWEYIQALPIKELWKKTGLHFLITIPMLLTLLAFQIVYYLVPQLIKFNVNQLSIEQIMFLVAIIIVSFIIGCVLLVSGICIYDMAKKGCKSFTNAWCIFFIIYFLTMLNSPFLELIKGFLGR